MGTTVREVAFAAGTGSLRGELTVPAQAETVVVLLSGGCGGVQAPQESRLGARLAERGIGTFAVDLLTAAEASDRANRQDMSLLCRRIDTLFDWLGRQDALDAHDVAIYGADTAAPAVLRYIDDEEAGAVALAVRNGRVDLIDGRSPSLEIPVLFVCDEDRPFLKQANETVYDSLSEASQQAEFLAIDGRFDGDRIATWFERQLAADRSAQRA